MKDDFEIKDLRDDDDRDDWKKDMNVVLHLQMMIWNVEMIVRLIVDIELKLEIMVMTSDLNIKYLSHLAQLRKK